MIGAGYGLRMMVMRGGGCVGDVVGGGGGDGWAGAV